MNTGYLTLDVVACTLSHADYRWSAGLLVDLRRSVESCLGGAQRIARRVRTRLKGSVVAPTG
jgi:hypothetical protein